MSLDRAGSCVSRFVEYFDQTPVGACDTARGDIDGVAGVFSNGILNAVGDFWRCLW